MTCARGAVACRVSGSPSRVGDTAGLAEHFPSSSVAAAACVAVAAGVRADRHAMTIDHADDNAASLSDARRARTVATSRNLFSRAVTDEAPVPSVDGSLPCPVDASERCSQHFTSLADTIVLEQDAGDEFGVSQCSEHAVVRIDDGQFHHHAHAVTPPPAASDFNGPVNGRAEECAFEQAPRPAIVLARATGIG